MATNLSYNYGATFDSMLKDFEIDKGKKLTRKETNIIIRKAIANEFLLKGNALDCGAYGKANEILQKILFENVNGKWVLSRAWLPDTKKHGYSYEMKINCGELATMNEYGDIIRDVRNSDYMVYSAFIEWDTITDSETALDEILNGTYVIPMAEFWAGLDELGLIRTKRSSKSNYINRITIQSYKNSKKKSDELATFLNGYSLLVDYLADELGIMWD